MAEKAVMRRTMNVERLRRLVNNLRALRPEAFNISTWGRRTECGTVACAMGWAGLDPENMKEGFVLADVLCYLPWAEVNATRVVGTPMLIIDDNPDHNLLGWDAVEEFFGLHPTYAHAAFADHYDDFHPDLVCPPPQIVADFVAKVIIPLKTIHDIGGVAATEALDEATGEWIVNLDLREHNCE